MRVVKVFIVDAVSGHGDLSSLAELTAPEKIIPGFRELTKAFFSWSEDGNYKLRPLVEVTLSFQNIRLILRKRYNLCCSCGFEENLQKIPRNTNKICSELEGILLVYNIYKQIFTKTQQHNMRLILWSPENSTCKTIRSSLSQSVSVSTFYDCSGSYYLACKCSSLARFYCSWLLIHTLTPTHTGTQSSSWHCPEPFRHA